MDNAGDRPPRYGEKNAPLKGDNHWIDLTHYILNKIDNRMTLTVPTMTPQRDVSAWNRW